jgi:hypothetical protein
MSAVACKKADCTIAATGKCLEAHPTPQECPFYISEPDDQENGPDSPDLEPNSEPDAAEADGSRSFHAGLELGFAEAQELARSRYVHLVAILGATNAGKTCLLVSIYLMAVNRMLAPFRFAGSRTLLGFEHRARGLRKWDKGQLPAEFADHTRLGDPRSPSFVHIALNEESDSSKRREMLLTDLPGEWTTDLINRADSASRFHFLARADAVLITLDGPRLVAPETRQQEIMQAENLLQRLAQAVTLPTTIRIILLVSKCDELLNGAAASTAALKAYSSDLGYETEVIETAAISRDPNRVANGHGILDLLKLILKSPTLKMPSLQTAPASRAMLRFQRRGKSR